MNIKIIKRLESEEWENFVENSNNGTIFHQLKFLSYYDEKKLSFSNLAFYDKNDLIAVLPGGIKNNFFFSPLGSTYGSIVVKKTCSFLEYEQILDTFLDFCKKEGLEGIYLTPPPIIYSKELNQTEDYLLLYKGFEIKKSLLTSAVNIKKFKSNSDILKSLTSRCRRDIYISKRKKVKVRESKNYKSFYDMLLKNKERNKTKPLHSFDEITKLIALFPKNIKLLVAYYRNNPIAAILLFVTNKNVALGYYICHYDNYQKLKGVSRLYYESIVWAKKNNLEWLDLGVSPQIPSENPMEPKRSLIFFKESINTRGFLRNTYFYKI